MAEQVDGIEIVIDVDTQAVIEASKRTNAALESIEGQAKELDTTMTKTGASIKAALGGVNPTLTNFNQSVKQAGAGVKVFQSLSAATFKPIGNDVANLANQFTGKLNPAILATEKVTRASKRTLNKHTNAFASMGRTAGQAGIQVQQLIGQVTAGTNPLVAFSQQAADLGFVLGVPLAGAVVSIAAALATVLVPSLFDSGASVDELREKLKRLEEETGLTANQTALLAQEDRKAIEEKQKRIKALKEEIAEQERLNRLRTTAGTGTDTGQFAIPRSAADNAKRYADAIKESEETIVKNKAEVDLLNQEIIELSSNVERYDQGQQEALKKIEQQREFAKKLNQELALIQTKSESGALAAAKLAAAFELGLTNAEMLPPEIDKTLELLFKAEEAEKAAAEAAREKARAEREAQQAAEAANRAYERNLDTIAKQIAELEGSDAAFALWSENMRQSAIAAGVSTEAIDAQIAKLRELREEQEASKDRKKIEQAASGLGLTGVQLLDERYEQERQAILDAQAAGIESKIAYEERLTQLQEEYSNKRAQIIKQEAAAQYQIMQQSTMNSLSAFASTIGNLAEIAEKGGEKSFGIYKALASAQAAIAATMAVLSVLGDPTVPTYLKPILAGSIAGLAGAQVAMINKASYGGGRLYGGGVEAGKLYPVTEDGRPEILQQGNKSYLLPGSRGNVVSNKDISMGAPNINIMIDNSAAGVEVVPDVRQNGGQTDVRLTVRAVAADIRRGGEVYSAMKDSFNVKGRTG